MIDAPMFAPIIGPALITWAACTILAVAAGWALTAGVLKIAKAPKAMVPRERIPILEGERTEMREVMRGGTLIGVLERTIITTAMFFGADAIVVVALAIKGLGRYPELKAAPQASERFIIGTFVSVATAIIIGLLGRHILFAFVTGTV